MNQAEYLGAKLVMEIRRQAAALIAWQESTAKINDLYEQIEGMSGTETYASTGEIPRVTPAEAAVWLDAPTEIRPLRPEHLDGADTFRLTPVADTVIFERPPGVVPEN